MAEPKPDELKIDFDEFKVEIVKEEDALALPVTGAMGGPAPDGSSIIMHLYYEHPTLPDATFHSINKEGLVNMKEANREERTSHVRRRILSTFLMSPSTAKKIGAWLIERSEMTKDIRVKLESVNQEKEEIT